VKKPYRAIWDERAGVAANARRQLPLLVADYFARASQLLAEDPSPAKLHRLRLDTKRLRYTLELFRSCYGPGLRTRLQWLHRVQQLLGEVNDSVAAAALLPAGARGRGLMEDRARAKAREFREYWAAAMDAADGGNRWTAYLSRSVRPR
jgi:CHAD domain-containing protein